MGNKRRYAFQPVGMDALAPKPGHPTAGTQVVFSNQGGMKSHRSGPYRNIEHADTGDYFGMALKSSLIPVTKANPGNPDPVETARAASLINDRRTTH